VASRNAEQDDAALLGYRVAEYRGYNNFVYPPVADQ
jgi:hypothetical protein